MKAILITNDIKHYYDNVKDICINEGYLSFNATYIKSKQIDDLNLQKYKSVNYHGHNPGEVRRNTFRFNLDNVKYFK